MDTNGVAVVKSLHSRIVTIGFGKTTDDTDTPGSAPGPGTGEGDPPSRTLSQSLVRP